MEAEAAFGEVILGELGRAVDAVVVRDGDYSATLIRPEGGPWILWSEDFVGR